MITISIAGRTFTMKTTLTTKITSYETLSYETLYLVSFSKKILVPQCKQIRLSNAFITFFVKKKRDRVLYL